MHGGMGMDHTYLHPWLDPLGDVLHLVYYDHRGNGRSGRPPIETLTFEQYAADADALREHLGFSKVAVLGQSAGGFIALKYAILYPQYLSHLILVDTAPAWDYGEEIKRNRERKGMTPEMRAALDEPEPSTIEEMERMNRIFGPLYFHDYDAKLEEELFGKVILNLEASKRYHESLRTYNVVPHLGEINAPTLILVGRDDIICPLSQAERMHKAIPESELVVFEKSGHLPYAEEPDAFFSTVRKWIKQES
jgi:proline iminopeptidase